ncbi:polymer-forming cytoskeletal protein [Brevibacillus dissolubilis]|uniref:polymer-forming cytoskeletal protein n=1 Tax=Brevibacillus dissolubilis TaxID=1844116 RepID=UPI00111655B4|nr:polymer-forming cytoskeletal protein [Brevibacillus dissolubilis]
MRAWLCLLFACLFTLLPLGAAVHAIGTMNKETYVLTRNEVHHGDLMINARQAVIEGTVDGDLYLFAENVQVTGTVKGDIHSFTDETVIDGQVEGDVRTFSHHLRITGDVGHNVMSASTTFTLTKEGQIHGSLFTFSTATDLLGKVGREANGFADTYRITGLVGEGISLLHTDHLRLDSTAVIGGNLTYTSPERATIQQGAVIKGKELYSAPPIKPSESESPLTFPSLLLVMSFLSTLVLWLLIRYLFPSAIYQVRHKLQSGWGSSLGIGILTFLAVPILSILLLVTVIGIPIAIVLVVAMCLLMYAAKIFVGTWLGHRLADQFGWRLHPLFAELAGIIGLFLLFSIPLLGIFFHIGVGMLFLGAITGLIRDSNRHMPAI